jgi:hypothetical protein
MPWEPLITVAALGIFGGVFGTLFSSGLDVPIHPLWTQLIGPGPKAQIGFHFVRNLLSGGVAAVATWVLYSPVSAPTVGQALGANVMVGAFLTGAVGATVVSSLLASIAKDKVIDTVTRTSTDILEAEIDRRVPPVEPPASGEESP